MHINDNQNMAIYTNTAAAAMCQVSDIQNRVENQTECRTVWPAQQPASQTATCIIMVEMSEHFSLVTPVAVVAIPRRNNADARFSETIMDRGGEEEAKQSWRHYCSASGGKL